MEMLRWTVELAVEKSWVADGFELTDERALEMLAKTVHGAHNSELSAKVVKWPRRSTILKVQGYSKDEIALIGAKRTRAKKERL